MGASNPSGSLHLCGGRFAWDIMKSLLSPALSSEEAETEAELGQAAWWGPGRAPRGAISPWLGTPEPFAPEMPQGWSPAALQSSRATAVVSALEDNTQQSGTLWPWRGRGCGRWVWRDSVGLPWAALSESPGSDWEENMQLSLGRLSEGSPGWRQFPGGPPREAHTVGDCSSGKASLDRIGPWSADPRVRLPFLKTVLWAPVWGYL